MYNTSTLTSSSRQAGIKLAKIDWKMFILTICICFKIKIKNFLRDEEYMHSMVYLQFHHGHISFGIFEVIDFVLICIGKIQNNKIQRVGKSFFRNG